MKPSEDFRSVMFDRIPNWYQLIFPPFSPNGICVPKLYLLIHRVWLEFCKNADDEMSKRWVKLLAMKPADLVTSLYESRYGLKGMFAHEPESPYRLEGFETFSVSLPRAFSIKGNGSCPTCSGIKMGKLTDPGNGMCFDCYGTELVADPRDEVGDELQDIGFLLEALSRFQGETDARDMQMLEISASVSKPVYAVGGICSWDGLSECQRLGSPGREEALQSITEAAKHAALYSKGFGVGPHSVRAFDSHHGREFGCVMDEGWRFKLRYSVGGVLFVQEDGGFHPDHQHGKRITLSHPDWPHLAVAQLAALGRLSWFLHRWDERGLS